MGGVPAAGAQRKGSGERSAAGLLAWSGELRCVSRQAPEGRQRCCLLPQHPEATRAASSERVSAFSSLRLVRHSLLGFPLFLPFPQADRLFMAKKTVLDQQGLSADNQARGRTRGLRQMCPPAWAVACRAPLRRLLLSLPASRAEILRRPSSPDSFTHLRPVASSQAFPVYADRFPQQLLSFMRLARCAEANDLMKVRFDRCEC